MPILFMSSSSEINNIIIITIIIASGVTEAVLQFPVVTLRRLDQRQFDNPVNVSNGGNTITFRRPDSEYQVPEGTQSITLLCWASYPVYWALNENQVSVFLIGRNYQGILAMTYVNHFGIICSTMLDQSGECGRVQEGPCMISLTIVVTITRQH